LNYTVFDTHAFVKRLTAAGMPEAQAEVLADEQVRLIDDRLATKEDIAKLQAATKEDIAKLQAATKEDIARVHEDIAKLQATTKTDLREMELKIDAKIESVKSEIVKWMFGTIGFQTIVVVGAVVALARLAH
jgi:rRNA maturation endonuclease Nob1